MSNTLLALVSFPLGWVGMEFVALRRQVRRQREAIMALTAGIVALNAAVTAAERDTVRLRADAPRSAGPRPH